MDLSNLRPAEGSVLSDNFRRGRGHGSGNGKTAGKGHKGPVSYTHLDVYKRQTLHSTKAVIRTTGINVFLLYIMWDQMEHLMRPNQRQQGK